MKSVLLFWGTPLTVSSSVKTFNKPILKLSFNLPLNLIPLIILFSIVFPSISLVIPILLEKKGSASLV